MYMYTLETCKIITFKTLHLSCDLYKKPLIYVKGALEHQCNYRNTLDLIVALSRYSNYFTSVYTVGFLNLVTIAVM